MSSAAERIKEAAERDEAAAETEPEPEQPAEPTEPTEPEQPEVPETEPSEPEPAPEQPQAGQLTVEQAGELERATTTYIKKVGKIFGPEHTPPTCPACEGLGFDLSGGGATVEFRHASDKSTCDECDGHGGVLSGSKVPGSDVVRCERCKGAGYLVTAPVNIANPDQVAPVVMQLREGNADGGQAAALTPGDPGWEPWMGGGAETP